MSIIKEALTLFLKNSPEKYLENIDRGCGCGPGTYGDCGRIYPHCYQTSKYRKSWKIWLREQEYANNPGHWLSGSWYDQTTSFSHEIDRCLTDEDDDEGATIYTNIYDVFRAAKDIRDYGYKCKIVPPLTFEEMNKILNDEDDEDDGYTNDDYDWCGVVENCDHDEY